MSWIAMAAWHQLQYRLGRPQKLIVWKWDFFPRAFQKENVCHLVLCERATKWDLWRNSSSLTHFRGKRTEACKFSAVSIIHTFSRRKNKFSPFLVVNKIIKIIKFIFLTFQLKKKHSYLINQRISQHQTKPFLTKTIFKDYVQEHRFTFYVEPSHQIWNKTLKS